mmetsp:Transcript_51824/g.143490  ORF Transcript_51824/g.143490 Transcript_51824/m.143490 type:complete len:368 (-) Transcript_51824:292-1395(-)
MTVALANSRLARIVDNICRRSSLTASVFSFTSESSPFLCILCSIRSPSVNITRHRPPTANSAMPLLPLLVITSFPGSNFRKTRCVGRTSTRTCSIVVGTGFVRPPVQSTQTHSLPRKASESSRTDGGMVADQKDVCRPPIMDVAMPPCSTISSSWLPKPNSIMRSTSSKTKCRTRSSLQTPRCSASTSRPGVDTTMSAPCARSRSCERMPELPKSATLRSREYTVNCRASSCTCSLSSRVGTNTTASGLAGPFQGGGNCGSGTPTTQSGGMSWRCARPVASSNSMAARPWRMPLTRPRMGRALRSPERALKCAATNAPGTSRDSWSKDVRMGSRYAAVFPEPVKAEAVKSRPANNSGMVHCCTGVSW